MSPVGRLTIFMSDFNYSQFYGVTFQRLKMGLEIGQSMCGEFGKLIKIPSLSKLVPWRAGWLDRV